MRRTIQAFRNKHQAWEENFSREARSLLQVKMLVEPETDRLHSVMRVEAVDVFGVLDYFGWFRTAYVVVLDCDSREIKKIPLSKTESILQGWQSMQARYGFSI